MTDDTEQPNRPTRGTATRLTHTGRHPEDFYGFVNTPVFRGSTVLFPTVEKLRTGDQPYKYGRRGTPSSTALETLVAEIEGGERTVLTPSGLAAISATFFTFLSAGDHLLITDSTYQPTRYLADTILSRFGVEVEYYDPLIGAGIAGLLRHNTKMVYVECPGSQTFEMQDIPAIRSAIDGHNPEIWLVADNTWASPLFCKPFALGADISIQAGTKYIVGHADAMLGTVTGNARAAPHLVKHIQNMGVCAGSEEIFLGLRGMRTLEVRLQRHWLSAVAVAEWLQKRDEVAAVLHPALPGHPGHDIWRRDFSGASGLFSFVLHPVSDRQLVTFIEGLTLFGMGYSWGGYESLAIPFDPRGYRTATQWTAPGPAVRMHIGLEDPSDLVADIDQAFQAMHAAA